MRKQLALAVAVASLTVAAWAADKPEEKATRRVRLHVSGAYCQGCAGVLAETLAAAGVRNASKVPANRGRGHVIVLGEIDGDLNLAVLAQSINGAETPHRKQAAPGLAVELFADLDEESAAKALAVLSKVKGVDAEGSTADVDTGALSIKLTGEEELSLDALVAALDKGGVQARIVTEAPTAEAPE
jgi:hypothetical protein